MAEVTPMMRQYLDIKEANKLGFASAITPPTHAKEKKIKVDINLYEIGNVQRLINWFN